ncbi:cell wall metabolism sensor histidine kinase WalK [Nocardioides sp.]|uniref:sensor histidine kinase n=1 Tax=Nocardioides sp. TaxID=35761 RepID=UPI002716144C|nr:HAMP domain-containing sensor histidine kinase [Nocardioides sp.]MDO9455965.1 ATP-binding protein [Nocardioides sp.]
MNRFASLTSRLVVTAVLLVAVMSLLVGTATTFVMRDYLTGQLDEKVLDSPAVRGGAEGFPGGGRPADGDGTAEEPRFFGNQGPGALQAQPDLGTGQVLTRGFQESDPLSDEALAVLADVPTDGEVHEVEIDGFGTYRVAAVDTDTFGVLVTGLPTDDLDASVRSLVWLELLLGLAAVLVAAAAARTVVRRQLRPLREVAETAHTVAGLPLSSGEIGVTERVPEHLTDERTEVGQVGSALNTLLVHVETSLDARHASEQRIRQFVADASHELRTPLTTIAGYTELARRRPDDPETAATALTKVADESKRMTALVEDLLLLARLDSGRPLERTPVDLTRLLLEAVSDARVVAPGHHWRLDLPDEAVEVTGDEQRLHQVVTNLLTNARKYTPAGTTVTVSARAGGFSVHDDGPGFAPELVPHAFERFARADAARQREGGVGLGLALVEAIVTAHGGTVTLTTVPGDTRVDVTLS